MRAESRATLIDETRQAAFARLSGDYNPLHTDALHARRTQFGAPVVHGVHLVMLALEALDEPAPFAISEMDVQFRKAVLVGERASFTVRPSGESRTVDIGVNGQARASVSVRLTAPRRERVSSAAMSLPTGKPAVHGIEELAEIRTGEPVELDIELLGSLFPQLAASASPTDLAVILATTRVVGMRCPGEWALFRRLLWRLGDRATDGAELWYFVKRMDPRFSLMVLSLEHEDREMTAEVIVRSPPPAQPALAAVREVVEPDEFSRVRALVIGGSRGLGEIAAKAVVAGGGRVMLSFRSGEAEATALSSELAPAVRIVRLDVTDLTDQAAAAISEFEPTHLLYFATPVIAMKSAAAWDCATFESFVDVYVTGLSRLLAAAQSGGRLAGVFYPSSIFVSEQPAGFGEYVAAKAAGEEVCGQWQRIHPRQCVVVSRLPPLVTDQTAAKLGSDTHANLDTLMPALRSALATPR